MRYWLTRLPLFFAPFMLVLGAAAALAYHSGEAMPLAMVHAIQEADFGIVFQPRDRETIFAYKVIGVERKRPDVVIVGSSRVLRFRRELLTHAPDSFYNAGINGLRLYEAAALVEQLTLETAPQVLIFSIDQYWLNAVYDDSPTALSTNGDLTIERVVRTTRRTVQDVLRRRISIGELLSARNPITGIRALGLRAISAGEGYLSDGSRFYSTGQLSAEEAETILLENGQTRRSLIPGDKVSADTLATIDAMLARAEALNMVLIGVTLPLSPDAYAIIRSSDHFGYLDQAGEALAALFEGYGQPFIDLTDPAILGVVQADMADGIHASERLSIQSFEYVVRAVPALSTYTDPDALAVLAANSPDP